MHPSELIEGESSDAHKQRPVQLLNSLKGCFKHFHLMPGRQLQFRFELARTAVCSWPRKSPRLAAGGSHGPSSMVTARYVWSRRRRLENGSVPGLNGEDGDEPPSLRMRPGRKMAEVTRCTLDRRPFQKTKKSVGINVKGNMCGGSHRKWS